MKTQYNQKKKKKKQLGSPTREIISFKEETSSGSNSFSLALFFNKYF